MRKKLLFLTTMLLLFATSCHKEEFSVERARELASLHPNASEYTESEVEEVESTMEAYINFVQTKIDDALSEHDLFERKRKIAKLAAWCKNNIDTVDIVVELAKIVKQSPYGNQEKLQSFLSRITEVQMELSMIQREF